jgi:signal transduction histidine kinase
VFGEDQTSGSWMMWVGAALVFVIAVIFVAFLFSIALRKGLRRGDRSAPPNEFAPTQPRSENVDAFMAASTQAVIQRLREQEKELERLHRTEKERAAQTERLSEAVTRNMPTGLLLVNAAGLIQMANPAASTALGVAALSFRRYSEVLGADSALTRLLASCLQEGRTFQREEVEHRTPGGELRQLGVTISPTYTPKPGAAPGEHAKPTGAVCLLSDLTELTALQKQFRMQENMAALGEMSAGIAHEFKNALAIISGYAQMIRSEASTPDVSDQADRILKEIRALTHVVTEFLRFAKPLQLTQETVSIGLLVQQVAGEVHEAIPSVAISTEGEFVELSADEGLLRQALLNLVRNAAESAATRGDGASVVVRGGTEDTAGRPAQRISILDNGPGIPEESLGKIFVPFYTTKSNGTGLGLAVVQKIALQHGGAVEARNRAEGGAEFILWLPLAGGKPEAVASAPARI